MSSRQRGSRALFQILARRQRCPQVIHEPSPVVGRRRINNVEAWRWHHTEGRANHPLSWIRAASRPQRVAYDRKVQLALSASELTL